MGRPSRVARTPPVVTPVQTKYRKFGLVFLIVFLPLVALFGGIFWLARGQTPGSSRTAVLYVGDSTGNVLEALQLDPGNVEVTIQTSATRSVADLAAYEVVILNDVPLTAAEQATVAAWAAQENHGVVVIMGPRLTAGTTLLATLGFTTATRFANNTGFPATAEELAPYKGLSVVQENVQTRGHPVLETIVWNTAPELFYFTILTDMAPDVVKYTTMQWNGNVSVTDHALVAGRAVGANQGPNAFVFAGWFQDEFDSIEANEHFMVWPYFNYLMFTTTQAAAGKPVPEYGRWEYSPVPHFQDQVVLGLVVLVTGLAAAYLYYRVRKNKQEHREVFVTSDLDALGPQVEPGASPSPAPGDDGERDGGPAGPKLSPEAEVVIPPEAVPGAEAPRAVPVEDLYVDEEDDWEAIGFHRQIGGFFKLFFVMLFLLIPQLLVTSIVMPRFLAPYPQANGWYSYTLRFFEAIWLVFDMGFSFAITKFFAQHRLERPEKAYHYVQLFVWWEILSGVVQIFLVAFLGAIVFPLTNFSYLSWMFVAHSLIQFPGFYLVFQYFFQGQQRADYHMIAFALQYFILRMVLQVVTVPLFRAIYAGDVMYGAAFGVGIGLLIGQLLGDVVLFFLTMLMYKKMNLPVKPIFAADYTMAEFTETIKFGGKMVLGQMWVPLGWLLQVYLVGVFLPNSSAEQGYFELAFTISTIPQAISLLMGAMLGGLTEAHEYEKHDLLNYSTFSGIKWGNVWTIYLCTVFWAIGAEFIIGASGPNWARAAALIPFLMIYRLLGPISWQADYEFAAADKPLYAGIAWIIEQAIRGALMFVLLANLNVMEAVVMAYWVALGTKDVIVLALIRKKIHKWDWHPWQAFVAPILAGIANFLLLRGLVFLVVDALGLGLGILSAMLLFVVSLFLFEHVYSFFVGLFGGYDDNTLAELRRATGMVTGVGGFARLYYRAARAGAKLSPLHNKFPVRVYEAAQREAAQLTAIKKKIVLT